MDFSKLTQVSVPSLPKEISEGDVSKAFAKLEKANKAFNDQASDLSKKVKQVKEDWGSLHTAVAALIKNASKDPKKAKAANEFLHKLSTFKENFTK